MMTPPNNTPLQIRVPEGNTGEMTVIGKTFFRPQDDYILSQMGNEWEWAIEPEFTKGSLDD